MEKELLTVVIVILVVILLAAVMFRLFPSLFKKQNEASVIPDSSHTKRKYNRIIDDSRSEYDTFMTKQKLGY